MIKKNEEQLENNDVNLVAVEQNIEKNDEMDKELISGSSKFKNSNELLKAYENLEKEFTKKCQKLSALLSDNKTIEKEKFQINSVASEREHLNKTQNGKTVDESDQNGEIVDENSQNNETQNVLPQYEREDWQEKTQKFFEENALAKNFCEQIAKVLIEDEELSKKDDALELAYSRVLKKNFVTKEQLAEDEEFLNEFVYKNENIKNKIIENYVFELQKNKNVPLIASSFGSQSVSSPKFRAKDLDEAGKFAMHILKK